MTSMESQAVAARYGKRVATDLYSRLRPEVLAAEHEKETVIAALLAKYLDRPLADASALEVGCGHGDNLLSLLRLGFRPANLVGNELLPERVQVCRERVPQAIKILEGDATALSIPDGIFDLVYQSTVFTSLLDDEFQQLLAKRMWNWVRPGGGVLWYDFTWNNPSNPDVRGVPLRRIADLFPGARRDIRRVTLAPPLSRRLSAIWPPFAEVAGMLPFLRTHVCCWLSKPKV